MWCYVLCFNECPTTDASTCSAYSSRCWTSTPAVSKKIQPVPIGLMVSLLKNHTTLSADFCLQFILCPKNEHTFTKCQTYIIIYLSFSRSLFNAKKKSPKSLQPLQASIGHLSSFSAHEISPLSQTCRSWRLRHSVFCTCGMSSKPVIYQLYIVLPSVIWYVLGRVENILGILVIQEQGITKKPTSISWTDRGILNTAHMWNVWGI